MFRFKFSNRIKNKSMKKFVFMMTAILIAVLALAQSPQGKDSKRQLKRQEPTTETRFLNKSTKSQRHLVKFKYPKKKSAAPKKVEGNFTVIEEAPDGEERIYIRNGKCYVRDEDQSVIENQMGTVTMVFTSNNEVYIKDLISTFQMGTWVKGTVSADGKTITLPMFQGLWYQEEYDEYVILAIGKANGRTLKTDADITEITLTVKSTADGEIITMNGTSETAPIGAFWSGDDEWLGVGEWDTEFHEHYEDYTLVVPPSDLQTVDLPLVGKDLISYEDVSSTVKVGTSGSDVYIQGLILPLPDAWVKGTLAEGKVTFSKQFVGLLGDGPCFMAGYNDGSLVPLVMFYDADLNSYDVDGLLILNPTTLEMDYENELGTYAGIHIGARPDAITPPANLKTTAMWYSGKDYSNKTVYGMAHVGLDGNDVYIQNLLKQVPEGWIKGTFNENKTKVTFPCGQYVGLSEESSASIFIVGEGSGSAEVGDIVFNYDEVNNIFELQSILFLNGRKDQIAFYDVLQPGLVIGKRADISWVAGEQNYGNGQEVTSIQFDEFTSGVLAKNGGATSPTYSQADKTVLLNANNTFTVTSSKKIGKIVLTMEGTTQQMQLAANCGTYALQGTNGTLGVWEGESNNIVFTVPDHAQAHVKAVNVFYYDYSTKLVDVPADLKTDLYYFVAVNLENNQEETREVKIGFYGENEVYIQGLSDYVEDGWLKGELKDDVLTIPGWFLGYYDSIYGFLKVVFNGAAFTYDKESDIFVSTEGFTSKSEEIGSVMDEYATVVLMKMMEIANVPKQPRITEYKKADNGNSICMEIPSEDVDDNPMLSTKLSYQLFVDINKEVSELVLAAEDYEYLTEDMTVIPYNFTDYFDILKKGKEVFLYQPEQEKWNKIGVKSIYTGGGETNETEIAWYVIKEYDSNGIHDITVDQAEQPIYNLQGIRVNRMQKNGFYIKGGKKIIKK